MTPVLKGPAAGAPPDLPTAIARDRGIWRLTTAPCPFCGKRHTHGGGPVTGPPSLGHRVAHCAPCPPEARAGYVLVADTGSNTDRGGRP